MINIRPTIEYHYEEQLPCESNGMKESYKREQETLIRIEMMKWHAMLQGHDLKFNPRYYIDEASKHFKEPERIEKEGIPKLKFSYLKTLIKKIRNE